MRIGSIRLIALLAAAASALAVFDAIPTRATAADLEGKYMVEGRDPNGGTRYQGQVVVVKESSTYAVVWKIQNQVLYGTGILQNNVFAVTYLNYGPRTSPGLAIYDMSPEGTLTGRFTQLGAKDVGVEAWIPLGEATP